MQELERATEDDDGNELWNGQGSNKRYAPPGPAETQTWYKKRRVSNQPNPLNSTFHTIKSINTGDPSFYGEESDINKSSMSFDDSRDSSNIYHHHSSFNDPLVSTAALSDKAREIFKFQNFNKMQSKSFQTVYHETNNCVISAPTGSGKTVLFELAILKLLNFESDTNNLKILYIAPTKSLCLEKENDWRSKFSTFGLTVGALTSDTSFTETDKVKKANIIITTPEKWDLMTRKWNDYSKLFKLIKLLLVDEIHILRDNRGSTLEVVVTRMKKICRPLRIIALSATVPNIQDVSGWVKLNSESPQNAVTLVFGDDYRPVKLEKVVLGYKQTMNDFAFDTFLNPKLADVIREHSNSKPVLVFCPTRNSTVSTAKYLAKSSVLSGGNHGNLASIREKELRELSNQGVAYHNAGLSLPDRLAVESNFINGSTRILCSTSTLAVGVNLPAYLVVIKGTKGWTGIAFHEYSELDLLQMMGRAGRPQFETEGKAILLTSSEKQSQYEKLVKGNEKLESRLHVNLSENIVPEVYLGTIKSIEGAIEWMKLTFFYSRFKSNPTAYDEIPYIQNGSLDDRLMNYTESKLRELVDYKLIEIVNGEYHCTPYGNAMTRHYILFNTMKMFVKCPMGLSVADIIVLLSKSEEFSTIRLKRTEKKLFKEINSSPILKFSAGSDKKHYVALNEEKINLLIQYELGGLEFPNNSEFFKLQQSFKQDKFYVFKHIGRLAKCLVDCFLEKGDFISLFNCLSLTRCLNGKCWEDTPIVLRQLEGIGIAAVRRFSNQNISSFSDVNSLPANKIEYYLNQRPGFGVKVLNDISNLPNFMVETNVVSSRNKNNSLLVNLRINLSCVVKMNSWHGKPITVNVISGLSTGELVDFRRAHISKLVGNKSFSIEFPINFQDALLTTSISCEDIGDTSKQSTFEKNGIDNDDDDNGFDDDFDDMLVEATSNTKINKSKKISNQIQTEPQELDINGNVKCKHACIAPSTKRSKTKQNQDQDTKPSKESNSSKLKEKNSTNSKNDKQLTGVGLLNKLHEKVSPNNTITKPTLSRFKYLEPDLSTHEPAVQRAPDNTTTIDTENSSDVISLLRDARLRGNVSKDNILKETINEPEPFEISSDNDESESSILMMEAPVADKKVIDKIQPTNMRSVDTNNDVYDDIWSDEPLDNQEQGDSLESISMGSIPDHQNFKSNSVPVDKHNDLNPQAGPLVFDHDENDLNESQSSFSGLDDILGSDVEVV
ncbi:hypothetical protein BN7_3155 [Wickerhamomyces ciferrii]|uniref:DNA 3'-5' helicase n=1 Tax=Wickerhamomyces ciferrii (strain ATCC 14091 / BCRC 22168 / CBS 111 / JCM 3599 / NBRC 0793 / NRRL Y-1031 F-60-10) TaxID=1206466 RepID=K0KN15_WICCF|nr:uncharacterized protein BN7_3155 [Wickerhamomyces ciferrii]CCH43602.1 hypothetical protein BN7_3155 [Wickerhamomyces ciferrii]